MQNKLGVTSTRRWACDGIGGVLGRAIVLWAPCGHKGATVLWARAIVLWAPCGHKDLQSSLDVCKHKVRGYVKTTVTFADTGTAPVAVTVISTVKAQ